MNQTRQTILTHIRTSLGRNPLDAHTIKNLEARLAAPLVHEQPNLGQNITALFRQKVVNVGGSFELIPNPKEIPLAVLAFLEKHNLPKALVIDSHLKELPWPPQLSIAYRAAQAGDVVSVSHAFAGIAETGSLILLSSPASPTTLNFLPENHLIILAQPNLVSFMEDVWKRLRTQTMPRTVNLITGPSRTADIEQTLQVGAHGPRRLHVILYQE